MNRRELLQGAGAAGPRPGFLFGCNAFAFAQSDAYVPVVMSLTGNVI